MINETVFLQELGKSDYFRLPKVEIHLSQSDKSFVVSDGNLFPIHHTNKHTIPLTCGYELLELGGKELLVVVDPDDEDIEIIKRTKIATVVVDLSFDDMGLSANDAKAVVYGNERKSWLYNPKQESLITRYALKSKLLDVYGTSHYPMVKGCPIKEPYYANLNECRGCMYHGGCVKGEDGLKDRVYCTGASKDPFLFQSKPKEETLKPIENLDLMKTCPFCGSDVDIIYEGKQQVIKCPHCWWICNVNE